MPLTQAPNGNLRVEVNVEVNAVQQKCILEREQS